MERVGRAGSAPYRCSRLADSRCRIENVIGRLLSLGRCSYYHPLVATEFGEPGLNIHGLVLEYGGRDSRFGAQISG
jgi:hypothetical protein